MSPDEQCAQLLLLQITNEHTPDFNVAHSLLRLRRSPNDDEYEDGPSAAGNTKEALSDVVRRIKAAGTAVEYTSGGISRANVVSITSN